MARRRLFFLALPLLLAGCIPGASSTKPAVTAGADTGGTLKADQEKEKWFDVSEKPITKVGGLEIAFVSAKVGKPETAEGSHWQLKDKSDFFILTIRLKNTDPKKIVSYSPWGQEFVKGIIVTDDLGNKYTTMSPVMVEIKNQAKYRVSLRSDEPSTSDVILFERPLAAASALRVELAGDNVGLDHTTIRWLVPKSLWSK